MSVSYYSILGVPENASGDEIKKAYRKLSLKFHPDRNKETEAVETYKKINEAYEVLGDETKRREHDMMQRSPFSRMHGFQGGGNGVAMDINELFGELFGGGITPGVGVRIFQNGQPVHMGGGFQPGFGMEKPTPIIKNIQITMEQVFQGANIPIVIERWIVEGGNKVFEKETIYLKIPKGVDENEIFILHEKGNVSHERSKGDIKIIIGINNQTEFIRKGIDLIYEKNITLKESLCGVSFDIKHINGKTYSIQTHMGNIISPGFSKVFPGLGLTRENDTGNLIIVFLVSYPEKLPIEVAEQLKNIL